MGQLILFWLKIQTYRLINKCSKNYKKGSLLVFVQSSKALLLTIIIAGTKGYYFNLFPIDFFFYFILGIVVKLKSKNEYEKIHKNF